MRAQGRSSHVKDIVSDVVGFRHCLHDEVVLGKGGSCLGLLVSVLPVDDGSEAPFRLVVNRIPDLGHPGAGCVDELAAHIVEILHLLQGRAKRRKDHDIAGLDSAEVLATLFQDDIEAHLAQSLPG